MENHWKIAFDALEAPASISDSRKDSVYKIKARLSEDTFIPKRNDTKNSFAAKNVFLQIATD